MAFLKNISKKTALYWGLIVTFGILYLFTAFISFYHSITFFHIANAVWLSVIFSLVCEIGQAGILFAILLTDNKNKFLSWATMILLTSLQIIGNVVASYKFIDTGAGENILYFQKSILFWVQTANPEMFTTIVAWVSGSLLPIIALSMTALVANNLQLKDESAKPLTQESGDETSKTTENEFGLVDLTNEEPDKLKTNNPVDIDESGIGGEPTVEEEKLITDFINADKEVEDLLDEEVAQLTPNMHINEKLDFIDELELIKQDNERDKKLPKEFSKDLIIPDNIPDKKRGRPPKLKEKAVVPKKEKGLLQKEEKVSVPQKELQNKLEAPQNKEVNKLLENIKEAEVKDSIINSKIIDEKSHDVILTPNDDKLYIDEYGVNVIDGKAVEKDDSKIKKN